MERCVVRLINKNNCIIDSYIAPPDFSMSKAVRTAIHERLWIMEAGDTINMNIEEFDEKDLTD